MELAELKDAAVSTGQVLAHGVGDVLEGANNGRLWLGRKVDNLAQVIHPKTVFFPSKTLQKLFDFIGHQFRTTFFQDGAMGFARSLPYVQSLFAVTGFSGLLNLQLKDFIPNQKSEHDHAHHDHAHHNHAHHDHHTPFQHAHSENIASLKFIKSFANLFDYSAGLFNCGFASILAKAKVVDVVQKGMMNALHGTLMLPRNVLSFAFHAGVMVKDIGNLHASYQKDGDLELKDVKEMLWKNGVPLARYGATLLQTAGFCAAPPAAAFAGFVSFGMATIQVFADDFKNEDVGGGCC